SAYGAPEPRQADQVTRPSANHIQDLPTKLVSVPLLQDGRSVSSTGPHVDNAAVFTLEAVLADRVEPSERNHGPQVASGDREAGRIRQVIDAHWHTLYAAVPMAVLMAGDPGFVFAASTAEAERTLLRGFTTVRDLGGQVFTFKQAIDAGVIPVRGYSRRE